VILNKLNMVNGKKEGMGKTSEVANHGDVTARSRLVMLASGRILPCVSLEHHGLGRRERQENVIAS
jgi:hypothetical protein